MLSASQNLNTTVANAGNTILYSMGVPGVSGANVGITSGEYSFMAKMPPLPLPLTGTHESNANKGFLSLSPSLSAVH